MQIYVCLLSYTIRLLIISHIPIHLHVQQTVILIKKADTYITIILKDKLIITITSFNVATNGIPVKKKIIHLSFISQSSLVSCMQLEIFITPTGLRIQSCSIDKLIFYLISDSLSAIHVILFQILHMRCFAIRYIEVTTTLENVETKEEIVYERCHWSPCSSQSRQESQRGARKKKARARREAETRARN